MKDKLSKEQLMAENYLQRAEALHKQTIETAISKVSDTHSELALSVAKEHYNAIRSLITDIEITFCFDEITMETRLESIKKALGEGEQK